MPYDIATSKKNTDNITGSSGHKISELLPHNNLALISVWKDNLKSVSETSMSYMYSVDDV